MVKNPFHICPICEQPAGREDFLCPSCREKINAYNRLPKCPLCGQLVKTVGLCPSCEKALPVFDLAISCYGYQDIFKEALIAYKFHREFYRAKGFSKLIAEVFLKLGVSVDYITAVPSGPLALWKRGYISPLEMAFPLKQMLKIPVAPAILQKKWFVKRQATLDKMQRLSNITGSFRCTKPWQNKLWGKRILLLDDVRTTGATVKECSKLLKENGAKAVYVVTLLGGGSD